MVPVPLDTFVDFVLKVGTSKVAAVKTFKENRYEHLTDFYRPLREAIIGMHEKGQPEAVLDSFLATLDDERKRRIFPGLVQGYRKFLGNSPKTWLTPSRSMLPIGDIEVDIDPELCFEINGRPVLIKLHFHGDQLSQDRVRITTGLMSAAMGPVRPYTTFAMLDVKRAKSHSPVGFASPRLALALRGEAAAFSTIYAGV